MTMPLVLQRLLERNTPEAWVEMLATTVAVFLTLRLLIRFVVWRSEKMPWVKKYDFLHVSLKLVTRISTLTILAVALYFGLHSLEMPKRITPWIERGVFLILALQVGKWMSTLIDTFFDGTLRRNAPEGDPPYETHATAIDVLSLLAKVVIYSVVALVILNNAGVNITALVTGLGIGGIAVALALQTVLGDLFASLTIILDKTFVIGDMVRVGELQGRIERLGLKATRIRSLTGEQVVIPNASLLQSQIRNFGRMDERRGVFQISVTCDTRTEMLRKIPDLVKEVTSRLTGVRLDYVHFNQFSESALTYEVVFYSEGNDFNSHMAVKEAVGLGILEALRANSVEMAFPTRTIIQK